MAETVSPCRFKSWIKTISPSVTTCTPLPFVGAKVGMSAASFRGMPPEAEPGGAQDRGVFILHIWGGYDRRSQARLENGVLRLSLPRPQEDKPRRIAIGG